MTLAVRIILVVSTLIMFTIIGLMVAIAFNTTSLAGAMIGLPGVAVGGLIGLWVARKLLRQQREYQSKIGATGDGEDRPASRGL